MRFKYETPSLFRKAAIGFKAPHRWRTGTRPWVFDNLSGVRFQLTQDEETVIRKLAMAMDKRTPAPSQDAAFDYVAGAIARKRLGYPFDWRRISAWTREDWDGWLVTTEPSRPQSTA
jgi:hypothetical protein